MKASACHYNSYGRQAPRISSASMSLQNPRMVEFAKLAAGMRGQISVTCTNCPLQPFSPSCTIQATTDLLPVGFG